MRDVLQRQHHQSVRFLVIPQRSHPHILTDQQFVQVPAEIVDRVEQELVSRKTEYLPDRIQPEGRPQPLRVGPVRKDEQQDARQNRIDDQRVQTGAAQRRYDRNRSASDLNDQIPHSQETETFRLVQQSVRHDIDRSEQQVDRQPLTQAFQDTFFIIRGNRPRYGEKQYGQQHARPHRERVNLRQISVGQDLVLYHGSPDSQIAEYAEKTDNYGRYRYDTEILRRNQACQYAGDHQRDDQARIPGDRRIEYPRKQIFL